MILSLLLYGCTSTSVFRPEHLYIESNKAITVYTTDGKVIKFKAGDYTVIESENSIIKGKGKLADNLYKEASKDWEGTIAFSEIKSMTKTEPITAGQFLPYVMIGAFAIMVWLATSPRIFSVH